MATSFREDADVREFLKTINFSKKSEFINQCIRSYFERKKDPRKVLHDIRKEKVRIGLYMSELTDKEERIKSLFSDINLSEVDEIMESARQHGVSSEALKFEKFKEQKA